MKNIILLGYMGAGKTSVGKVLARKLGLSFYDLDFFIEERFRRKVAEIFAERGEEGFRKIEYNMLHELAEFEDIVIAVGGGTPCFFDNMDYMNSKGITVFMNASPEIIVRHLKISHT
ncbi:MAG: shikimate kinase, partial [Bacteroidaceae bacterium]|nr:shikimate kinase [Bacteroidaceae bacterium]